MKNEKNGPNIQDFKHPIELWPPRRFCPIGSIHATVMRKFDNSGCPQSVFIQNKFLTFSAVTYFQVVKRACLGSRDSIHSDKWPADVSYLIPHYSLPDTFLLIVQMSQQNNGLTRGESHAETRSAS